MWPGLGSGGAKPRFLFKREDLVRQLTVSAAVDLERSLFAKGDERGSGAFEDLSRITARVASVVTPPALRRCAWVRRMPARSER